MAMASAVAEIERCSQIRRRIPLRSSVQLSGSDSQASASPKSSIGQALAPRARAQGVSRRWSHCRPRSAMTARSTHRITPT